VDPVGNPTTPQKALLGKALFWDEQLSSSRTVACGTCHIFGRGGTDPRATTATHPGPDAVFGTADDIHGATGLVRQDAAGVPVRSTTFGIRAQVTGRKAPSPINAAYENELFWDGRAGDAFRDPVTGALVLPANAALESQASGPPVSDAEMGHIGRSWTDIANDIAPRTALALAENIPVNLASFAAGQTYASLFQQVYGSPGVTPQRILFAIAAYERTLVSDQTRFDAFLAGTGTLTAQEGAGYTLFSQFCMICHTDLLPGMHAYGPGNNGYFNVGLRPETEDQGRFAVDPQSFFYGSFRTPQLRNVALRAPYMHNGEFQTLSEVIDFYNRGGDYGINIDPNVNGIAGQISAQGKANLLAFLQTLTDPRVALEQAPFNRPTLWSESARVPVQFGTGTAGTGGFVPSAFVSTPPFVGNAKFTLSLDRARAWAPTFLLLDFSASTTPVPVLGQNLYLTPAATALFQGFTQGSGAGNGYATRSLPIPAVAALAGTTLFGQWAVVDANGPGGMTSTNAFGITLF
jgi:cytochrome c peroxidase